MELRTENEDQVFLCSLTTFGCHHSALNKSVLVSSHLTSSLTTTSDTPSSIPLNRRIKTFRDKMKSSYGMVVPRRNHSDHSKPVKFRLLINPSRTDSHRSHTDQVPC
ncbi:uncharacterized protein YALI1_F05967g [Yarrowia lipolytica]|uniref:Uncharacterized protein n=1 Tax=Yarrowia lipolytica TaxID=4952 RepID=A0A1D8NLW6_YARLL|nr:hypothetical protein YALI1_F05967g [Yarrowia lipolytica]